MHDWVATRAYLLLVAKVTWPTQVDTGHLNAIGTMMISYEFRYLW
jgi:hypothetical protein